MFLVTLGATAVARLGRVIPFSPYPVSAGRFLHLRACSGGVVTKNDAVDSGVWVVAKCVDLCVVVDVLLLMLLLPVRVLHSARLLALGGRWRPSLLLMLLGVGWGVRSHPPLGQAALLGLLCKGCRAD